MIEGIPKISILIITYRQEVLIKRALDSLLSQKDYIYEICVSDDCSPDNTWEVLKTYDNRYPGLFKLHRQDQNVGIFENIEYSWTMPSGDIIYQLAGDDECGEGWFKTVINYIIDNKIDYKNERLCIYGDYKSIYPNGDTMIFRNNLVNSKVDPIYLFLRTSIGNRSVCYSIETLKSFRNVSQGRSHVAETAQEVQLPLNTEKNYYIPYVGNIYYSGLGVSTKTSSDTLFKERQEIVPYTLAFLEKNGYIVDPKFTMYVKANLAEKQFCNRRNLRNFVKTIYFKILSYDKRIGLKSIGLKQAIFAIRRRIPHNHPIVYYV